MKRKDTQQEQQFICKANKSSPVLPNSWWQYTLFNQTKTSVQMVYEQVINT